MHCITQTDFIGTQESVYRDSPIGNLDKHRLVRNMLIPLQQGFGGDCKTCLPIGIHSLTAFLALEDGIITRMSSPNSTAVGTPFTCMPAIYDMQRNIRIEASLFKDAFELSKGDTHDGSVESFALRFELSKVLNSYVGIESLCQLDDLSDNLTEVSLDKVSFIIPQSCQLLDGFDRLKFGTASHNLLPSSPDVFSKVCLIKNLTTWSKNRNSEMFSVDVDAEDILSYWNDCIFFGKISDNLLVGSQTEGLARPTIIDKRIESLKIPVCSNRNSNSISRIDSKLDEESALCPKGLAVPRNIEFDSNSFDFITLDSSCLTNESAYYLNIERGVCFAS